MPDYEAAAILHAECYLRILHKLNDGYIHGGKEQRSSLQKLDIELPNVLFARDRLPTLIARANTELGLSKAEVVLLDICNTFPDAGAYLISVKLNATDRIRWLKEALQASQRLENNITTQAHLGNIGLAYYELGELSQAVEYFTLALQLSEQIDDKYHQGAWLGDLGNVYAMMGNHKKAIAYQERHHRIAQENHDMRGEAHALANLGVSYAYLGELPKAVENYNKFLELAIKRQDRREESQALMNLGFAYYDMGKLEESDRSLQNALAITVELGDKLTESLVMGGIADLHIDRENYQVAIDILKQAMESLQAAYDVGAELRLLQSLGNAYTACDNYKEALETYSRLYNLAKSIGAKAAMCSALANRMSILRHIGDFEGASEIGEKGLSLAREINSLSDEAFIRWQIGLIYEAHNQKEKAIAEMETTIEIELKIDSLQLEKHQEYLRKLIIKK
jgi:tetratricopeptide (TPR) repeat protein